MKFKICMVGSYAVGKTSLVARFVHSIYSDKYLTTIGVKIDKKTVDMRGKESTCMIWDIAGEDEFYTVKSSYLRGMHGYMLVLDGTRKSTVEVAEHIQERIETSFSGIPFVLLVNKSDLVDDWEVTDGDIAPLVAKAAAVYKTSAATGAEVETAFEVLVEAIASG